MRIKLTEIIAIAVIATGVASVIAAPPRRSNPDAKLHRFSSTIEKERPQLDEETRMLKVCILCWICLNTAIRLIPKTTIKKNIRKSIPMPVKIIGGNKLNCRFLCGLKYSLFAGCSKHRKNSFKYNRNCE